MSFLPPGYFKDFLFVFGVQHFDYDIPSPLFLYIYFPSDISTSWMCGLTSFVSFGKFPGIFKSLQYFNIQYSTSLQILLCPILPLNFKFRTFFYLRSVILFLFLCISLDWCIYFHAFKKYFYLAIQKFASAVPTCPLKSILSAPTAPLIPLYVSVAQYILHVKLNLQI